jgi:uncharacterized protein (TIGR03437 family)
MRFLGDTARSKPTHYCGRLLAAVLIAGAACPAQPTAASLTTINQPTSGQATFDSSGNVYYLNTGPITPGAAQTQPGGGTCTVEEFPVGPVPGPCPAAQIVKVDPMGNPVYGTLLGGQTADSGSALAIDAAGDVFIVGSTGGQFPTTANAAIPASTTAATFAARLSADGSAFLYSTYLPASAATATGIAVDAQDNAYITGQSTAGAPYVIKLSPNGSTILYNISFASKSTSASSNASSGAGSFITMDPQGNVVVAGSTSAPDFPVTPGALQTSLAGHQNVFVAKLDPAGNILFSTYLGGSGTDRPVALQSDAAGNIYLAGNTSSLDFPTTPGSFEPTAIVPLWNDSAPGGFAAVLNPNGTALVWSTYVMSTDNATVTTQTGVTEMAVTPSGDVYLAGMAGAGFPVTPSAPQPCLSGYLAPVAGFVAHLNPQGALADATYLSIAQPYQINFVWGLAPAANGGVEVIWHYSGNNVASLIQFGSNGWTAPACLSTAVLNAATMSPGLGVAPGELVALSGFGIGPETGIGYQSGADGGVPHQLGGVQVFFDGSPAPVLYAQSREVEAIAPAFTDQLVTLVTVTYNGQQFLGSEAPVVPANPGVFRLSIASSQAAVIDEDSTVNGQSHPAAPGSIVELWATGLGITDPPCTIGGLNLAQPVGLDPSIAIQIPELTYAGSAPGLVCGVVQMNVRIPGGPAGNWSIQPGVKAGTAYYVAPVTATIAVQ